MSRTAARRVPRALAAALVAAAAAAGCQAPPRTQAVAPVPVTSPAPLRAPRVRADAERYAARFGGGFEQAAASVAGATADREIRRAATNWALRAGDESLRSLSLGDPAASVVDLWILAAQFRAHSEGPGAAAAWGEFQPVAIETAAALETEAHRLADSLGGSAAGPEAHELVARWAAENPLQENLERPPSSGFWARFRREIDPGLGGPAADGAGTVAASPFIAEQLARQTAMRAVLLLEDRAGGDAGAFGALAAPSAAVATPSRPAAPGPDAVAASVELMRLQTALELDRLVEDAVAEMGRQRRDGQDRLDALVADAINALDQQRAAAVGEVAVIVESAADDAFARAERLAGIVFWRAAALIGALFAALLVALLVASPRRRRGAAMLAPPAVRRAAGRPITAGHT